jgi:8-oxo-dGTP pyrophosphatase MutT (NUDIX family)
MPWTVVIKNHRFCVYKQDVHQGPAVGKSLGCHPTRDQANEQLKALYASEADRTAAAPVPGVPAPAQSEGPPTPSVSTDGPVAAGVALHSLATGRVLFIQRALIDGEAAGGLWEIPGGTIDDGETPWDAAQREFGEEVGHPLPEGEVAGTWVSPNGVYQGFCYCCASEDDVPLGQTDPANRAVDNPDNPGGSNYTESVAWMDPAHMDRGPRLLRPEMRTGTPWGMLKSPGLTASGGFCTPEGAYLDDLKDDAVSNLVLVQHKVGEEQAFLDLMDEVLLAAGSDQHAPFTVKLSTGWAYPIPSVAFLSKAIKAFGRAKPQDRAKVKAHIIARAKQLGASDQIPKEWTSMTASAAEEFESLVASIAFPASALLPEEPLPGPTPWTIKDDLTADGHLALWASCHIGYPGCVTPPREDSFDFFNLGDAVTADGRHVPVGKVTVGCGHAGAELSWRTAAAHYDHSGAGVAVAHAMADRWGIRLPAVIVADADSPQIDEARRSPLSGDWRRINGKLRLVAALGVNVPGYPVPRAMVASGEVESMFVGFNPEDAAAIVLEADSLAASIGLDLGGRAASLRESLGLST